MWLVHVHTSHYHKSHLLLSMLVGWRPICQLFWCSQKGYIPLIHFEELRSVMSRFLVLANRGIEAWTCGQKRARGHSVYSYVHEMKFQWNGFKHYIIDYMILISLLKVFLLNSLTAVRGSCGRQRSSLAEAAEKTKSHFLLHSMIPDHGHQNYSGWWWLEHEIYFSIQLRISSSQIDEL